MQHTSVSEPPGFNDSQRPGLGDEFLVALRAAYDRFVAGPVKYQVQRATIRRALLRRFPYAVYFAVESDLIIVVAVQHAGRDPRIRQGRTL
jgi:hypothetical protein